MTQKSAFLICFAVEASDHALYVFTLDLIKFDTINVHKFLSINHIFVKILLMTAIILLEALNDLLSPTFHIY